jgi:hypothetical protein
MLYKTRVTNYHLTELSPTMKNLISKDPNFDEVIAIVDLIYQRLFTKGVGGGHFMVVFPKFEDLLTEVIDYKCYLAMLLVYHILNENYRAMHYTFHPIFPFSSGKSNLKTQFLSSVFRLRKAVVEIFGMKNMGIQGICVPELAWYFQVIKSLATHTVREFISIDADTDEATYLKEIDQKFIKGIRPICFYDDEDFMLESFPQIIEVYKRVHFIKNNLTQIFN